MQSNIVNFTELKNLYSTNPKAKALFDAQAERERGRQDMTVARTRRMMKERGVDLTSEEFSDLCAKLQSAGVGRYVAGRNGKATRFLWGFHLKSVAEAAKGSEVQTLRRAPKAKNKLPKLKAKSAPIVSMPAPTPVKPIAREEGRSFMINCAGMQVQLPINMTPEEQKEVASFLSNLNSV